MKSKKIYYFVAALNFVSAMIWLVTPNPAKYIGTPMFLFAAYASLIAARESK